MKLSDWAARVSWSLIVCSTLLMFAGLLGIARIEQWTGGSARLFWHQVVFVPLALALMYVVSLPSYRALCRWSYVLLAISLVFLAMVFFFPEINGACRWVRIGPIGFQPSELAKVAFVLALARWLMHRENLRRPTGLIVPLLLTLAPVVLILREPDLGTALVFFPVLFAVLFAAGARRRDLGLVAMVGVLLLPVLWSQMSREQISRVTALADQAGPGDRPSDDAFHLYRAKQTLAIGGIWGTWMDGEPDVDARRFLVPAAATDSILCILGERFGLWGIALLLTLYLIVVGQCLAIARRTQEPFGRLVAVGIAALFAVQVLINTGMLVGLLPITGLSLPMVSYGGSGLMASAMAIGLVLNVGLRPGYEVAGEPFRFVRKASGR